MTLNGFNPVSAVLLIAFLIPVVSGIFSMLSRERVKYSLYSLLDNIELIAGILISVYVVKRIFFIKDGSIFNKVYNLIPVKIKLILDSRDFLIYVICVPLVLLIALLVFRLLTIPLYRYIIEPLSEKLYAAISSRRILTRRIVGGLWMIPKALVFTLVTALCLNFAMYYIYSPPLSDWMNSSKGYQMIYKNVMYPVLNSSLAKKIPVLLNDSFGKIADNSIPPTAGDTLKKLTGGNIRIIEYFNGVTIDEAVKSNSEVDRRAVAIVGNETDDKKKAYLIYKWICGNITYDYKKAEMIVTQPDRTESGTIPAFESRKGICFDFSCLYVSMCRAVGLKVRLLTGLGYSGTAWGDHAWNQVYYPDEKRWINLDTTFGSTGVNYFDKKDFNIDHSDSEVQGEW